MFDRALEIINEEHGNFLDAMMGFFLEFDNTEETFEHFLDAWEEYRDQTTGLSEQFF